ncbi:MAG: hypothetical protein SCH98_02035 [Deferrisomatales bacterium]|nr:hypothetical protein [Deferrisomatales bacterium]
MTVGRGLLSLVLILSAPSLAGARLAYYSDYFSFVGQDEQGRVAFALDTNRGQDGREFQAEHFAVLHAEGQGWIGLRGSGPFPNTGQVLEGLTDSEHFRFSGTPESGMTIESPENSLSLRIDAIPVHLDRKRGQDRYWMGSVSATLVWAGRTLPGRVIYEHIHFEDWNRLARTYPGFWRDFHGLYLLLRDPATGDLGDLYLHRQRSEKLAGLTGLVDGFAVADGRAVRLEGAEVDVTGRRPALGFYRWPRSWEGRWSGAGEELTFTLRLEDRKTIVTWIIGGFAMGIAEGTVRYRGRAWEAYGLGEIIK